MKRILYLTLLATFACAPSTAFASECGRPVSKGLAPGAVDSLYILQSAVGSRDCRLEDCDINSDCRISVSDALGTLRSAVGDDRVDLDCKAECPTIVRCGAEDAPVCNGTCPAEHACMPVDDDGEDHDDRVTICHLPRQSPSDAHTLVVGESSISAHLRHGDEMGPCEDLDLKLTARGRDDDDDDSDSGHDGKGDRHDDDDADCVCVPVAITTSTTMNPSTTTTSAPTTTTTSAPTTTTTSPPTTTTTMGPSIAAGQAIYDSGCQFCHGAGAHDQTNNPAGNLARRGSRLRNNLGSIDGQMQGLTLTDPELADLAAFLDSL